jgi:hypothetical protein
VLPLSSAVCSVNGNVKFNVCHIPPGNPANKHNICISPNALNAHLTSGSNGHNNCYLGPCRDLCVSTNTEQLIASRGASSKNEPVFEEEEVTELSVTTSPNPSASSFKLQIESPDKQTPVTIRVIDATGKPAQVFSKVAIGGTLQFGNTYKSGIYLVEVLQGKDRKVVKLIKL